MLLKRALYGIKQAPRQWYKRLQSELEQIGFSQSLQDKCLFIRKDNNQFVFLAVYVDNLLIVASNKTIQQWTINKMAAAFKIHDLGDAHHLLGNRILYKENGSISMDQEQYANDLLKRFNMTDANPCAVPLKKDTFAQLFEKNSQEQETNATESEQ